jgi:alpha-tubulin suppressor-like RCC1 family protein
VYSSLRIVTLCAWLAGCTDARTGVALRVTADPDIEPRVSSLRIRVFDADDRVVYDETRPADGTALVLPGGPVLRPESGAEARPFRVEALFVAGAITSTVRARSRYVEGEERELWLCLDDACRDDPCGASERCVAGRCLPLDVLPTRAGEIDEAAACNVTGPDGGVRDGGIPDAGCGCPCASDACDGSCTPTARVRRVSAGESHVCAIVDHDGEPDRRGSLYCWGANMEGELGVGDRDFRTRPTLVTTAATDVSGGEEHTCATLSDGSLWCWGQGGGDGRLGNDVGTDLVLTPRMVPGRNDWLSVEAGGEHTCGIASGNYLLCFGENAIGQLGVGSFDASAVPTQVEQDWIAVSLGDNHTCGIPQSGPPHCWGANDLEQLAFHPEKGETDIEYAVTPRRAPAPSFRAISSGHSHVCGIAVDDRALYCWGQGTEGQLGRRDEIWDPGSDYVLRIYVGDEDEMAPTIRWRAIAAGRHHTCGIVDNDGSLYCWGGFVADDGASLGLGGPRTENQTSPQFVASGDFADVTAGVSVSCATDSAGRLFCWGANGSGQLGVGDVEARFSPARVCFPP